MKLQFLTHTALAAGALAALFLTACNKADNTLATDTSTENTIASTDDAIAVSASASVATSDSVYVMQPCQRGSRRDSIQQSDLPAASQLYLDSAYAGFSFHKAYAIKNNSGTTTGYTVIIYFNGKPVGVEFDSNGAFVKTLEQRDGDGRHSGGNRGGSHFPHRGGKNRDSVAITALPNSVLQYFADKYSTDTLLKAFKTVDSSYVVLSKNNSLFSTVFDATGTFVKRLELPEPSGQHLQFVETTALPGAITTYLTQTYPGYTLKRAFQLKSSTSVSGYVVVIDANNTKYAVSFDASGTFLAARTIY